jgi:peptide/nickel transport system substrate-binding protein
MGKTGKLRFVVALVASASMAVGVSACSGSKGNSGNNTGGTGAKVQGGTVNVAESPQAPPTYIWPYENGTNFSTVNAGFDAQMYRPLYWFGSNNDPNVDYTESVGQTPVWSADSKSVSVTLKDWKWSDGTPVDAQDVAFFMNIYKSTADPKTSQDANNKGANGAYVPATSTQDFFPDNVKSWTVSGQTITFNLDKAYNHQWFLMNELAQITPMPEAWDATASGKSDCSTGIATSGSKTETDCLAVDAYLDKQGSDAKSWVGSPLWGVVDGPWKLKSFDAGSGNYSIVPNAGYNGPVKATLSQVNYVAETSDDSEYTVLKHGSTGSNALQVGYIPFQDVNKRAADGSSVNPLKAQGYVESPAPTYGYTYYQINYSSTAFGAVFKQLYFRKALQETIDQQGIVDGILKGWGYPTEGVVPTYPTSNLVSPAEKSNPVPAFDVAGAKALLQQNGWDTSTTPATCTKPGTGAGQCGAGVKPGQKLEFHMEWASGAAYGQTEVDTFKSDAAKAGIQIDLKSNTFSGVLGDNIPCITGNPAGKQAGCNWDALNWGAGWVYYPDLYPTGEELYGTNASSNQGEYSDPHMDQLIAASISSTDPNALYAYNDYATQQLVSPFFPTAIAVQASASNLHVDKYWNLFQTPTPEDWYYTK